jgi:hypothetical protein
MIEKLCDQLLNELEIAGSPLPSYFQPGVSRVTVDDTLQKINIKLDIPDEVYSLYQWRNGLNEDVIRSKSSGEVALFNLAVFNSLIVSVKTYQDPDVRKYSGSKGLFPLFESSGGDFYFMDTEKKSDTYKMIIFYSFANPYILNGASIFDSLDSCLTTVIECYRKKAYYYIPGFPNLEINANIEMSIWESNNPRSKYYKIMRNS